jgi:hypothetical protein
VLDGFSSFVQGRGENGDWRSVKGVITGRLYFSVLWELTAFFAVLREVGYVTALVSDPWLYVNCFETIS